MSLAASIRSTAALPRSRRTVSVRAAITTDRASLDLAKMAPLGDRVLIKPFDPETKTKGGIILATTSQPNLQEARLGKVLSVGQEVKLELQQGDTVLYSQYSSSEVETADGKIFFVAEKSILAKLA